jgi:hypothetical protein
MNVLALIDTIARAAQWFTYERSCATLGYVGGLLIGLDIYATILGQERMAKITARLQEIQVSLKPRNAREKARRFTVGPVAALTLILAAALFIWVIVAELRDPAIWRLFAASNANPTLWQTFWLVLLKPILCVGLAAGVFASRSQDSEKRFHAWMDRLSNWTFRGQMKRDLPQSLIVAFTGSFLLAAFWAGFVAGALLMGLVFRIIEAPLRLAGFLLEKQRLRRTAAIIGLAMITAGYVIQMVHG